MCQTKDLEGLSLLMSLSSRIIPFSGCMPAISTVLKHKKVIYTVIIFACSENLFCTSCMCSALLSVCAAPNRQKFQGTSCCEALAYSVCDLLVVLVAQSCPILL